MSVDFSEYGRKMDKTLDHLAEEFGAVRAGRANAKVLDRIVVEYYGQETPLNGVATISSPDARTLVIQPWDTQLLKEIQKAILTSDLGINPQLKHICNSCGAIRFDYARLDAVRIGSAFLGRLPIPNTLGLKRLVSLKCSVGEIRNLPKGSVVGYANTYVTKRDTVAAVIPVGYKDGYGVQKSNDVFRFKDVLRYMLSDFKMWKKKIYVEINGKKYPVIGRISMHNIVVDVTDLPVQVGDTATLECNPILIKSEIERLYI